ncbi:MAG: tetratricopeptide repeat protein [Alphaproteobacteria bacterium]|nr:tetratricopeptide repeat protein [Alphaproteobacteria bacterium]
MNTEAGRNDPCPCGSGKKYKKCHGDASATVAAVASALRPASVQDQELAAYFRDMQAFYGRGDWQSAILVGQRAASRFPQNAEVHYLLGSFLGRAGRLMEAEQHLLTSLKLNPNSEATYLGLAGTYHNRHEYARVVALIEDALKKLPNPSPELWYWYGFALHANDHIEQAIAAFRKVLDSPANLKLANDAQDHLYYALLRKGDRAEAEVVRERIRRANPRSAVDFSCLFVTPTTPEHRGDIARCRAEIHERFARLRTSGLQISDPDKTLQTSPFLLAFHGENDRDLLAEACATLRQICPDLNYVAPHCVNYSPPENRRIRIGVISQYLYRHSVGSYFRGLIAALHEAGDFEVVVMSPGGISDANVQALKSACDRFVPLPVFCSQARDTVAREQLDILLYLDVGMNVFSYIMPFYRLAPVQCVLPGHPDTTGIDTMDLYLSSARLEPENGQEHYREKLVNIAHFTAWGDKPALPAAWDSKAAIGFPEAGKIYFCPMTLYKIHPDFDDGLELILQKDPEAQIIFVIPMTQARMADLVKARLEKRLGALNARIHFIPWLKPDAFLSALHHADVILDTFHFGGGTTFYSMIAVGTPFVTLPGALMRGRIGLGMAELLDMPELVAKTVEDYADIAIRIAHDEAWRESLKQRITQRGDHLFGDQGSGRELAALLKTLHPAHAEA